MSPTLPHRRVPPLLGVAAAGAAGATVVAVAAAPAGAAAAGALVAAGLAAGATVGAAAGAAHAAANVAPVTVIAILNALRRVKTTVSGNIIDPPRAVSFPPECR